MYLNGTTREEINKGIDAKKKKNMARSRAGMNARRYVSDAAFDG